jgi:hypothetical protein
MPVFKPVPNLLPRRPRRQKKCPPLALLLAQKEGRLADHLSLHVTSHLHHCGLCRTLLKDLDDIPPDTLSRRKRHLLRRILLLPPKPALKHWYWLVPFAAAILAIAVFVFTSHQ